MRFHSLQTLEKTKPVNNKSKKKIHFEKIQISWDGFGLIINNSTNGPLLLYPSSLPHMMIRFILNPDC